MGSLRYTLAWDVVASAFLLLVFFFGGRLESYWLSFTSGDTADSISSRDVSSAARQGASSSRPRRNARFRQLLAVWRVGSDEIARLCGADARDYLVVQSLLLKAMAATCVPGVFLLLPIAVTLGTAQEGGRDGTAGAHGTAGAQRGHHQRDPRSTTRFSDSSDASYFSLTTVHHFPDASPYLWVVLLVSLVALASVEFVADRTHATLVRGRHVTPEFTSTIAGTTLLLRRLPKAACANPDAVRRGLSARFPGRVHAVIVPSDGGLCTARRRVATARKKLRSVRRHHTRVHDDVGGGFLGREVLVSANSRVAEAARLVAEAEDDLRELRRSRVGKGAFVPNPGCAFVVFKDFETASRALKALRPTLRGSITSFLAPILPFGLAVKLAPGFAAAGPGDAAWDFGEDDRAGGNRRWRTLENGGEGSVSSAEEGLRTVSAAFDGSTAGFLSPETRRGDPNAPDPARRTPGLSATDATTTMNDATTTMNDANPDGVRERPPYTPRAVALALGHGAHFWRCDRAPPPSGVLWENVGVTPGGRFLLSVAVNVFVFLGLVFVSSPLALFSYAGEVAAALDPNVDWRWEAWLNWARNAGGPAAGLVFQFVPNVVTLVMIYLLIPKALERATRTERHLTRSGALRSLVSKEFWYFLVNLLLLLALGKAALSAVVEQVRACQWHATPDACELRFVRILGESFVAEAAMSLFGFLCTCCSLGPAWEVLSLFSWIREAAWDGKRRVEDEGARLGDGARFSDSFPELSRFPENRRANGSVPDSGRPDSSALPWMTTRRAETNSFANATPSPARFYSRALDAGASTFPALRPSPIPNLARRFVSPRRPVFDLPGQHAFNAVVLACVVTFAALAPILLIPGTLFFAMRYLVHKHNLLCLHLDAVAGAGASDDAFSGEGDVDVCDDADRAAAEATARKNAEKVSDGRLLATVVHVIRVSAVLHGIVMACFLHLRGTDAQKSVAAVFLVVVVSREKVQRLFRGKFRPARRLAAAPTRVERNTGASRNRAADEVAHRDDSYLDLGSDDSGSEGTLGSAARPAGAAAEAPPDLLREAKKYFGPSSRGSDGDDHELEFVEDEPVLESASFDRPYARRSEDALMEPLVG
jgi:hypothetical protein